MIPSRPTERRHELCNIRQGSDSVNDYAIRFRTLATDSGWNDTALYNVFLKGLSDQIQDLLLPLDLLSDLDSLITLAIRTDNCLQERKRDRNQRVSVADQHRGLATATTSNGQSFSRFPSPVRGGCPLRRMRNPCSWEEPNCPQRSGVVVYRKEGASIVGSVVISLQLVQQAGSPVDGRELVSRVSCTEFPPRALTEIQVKHHNTVVSLEVFIDSGADESLMDWGFAKRLNLETEQLAWPLEASALDGSRLFKVTHKTEPWNVIIGDHQEHLCFHL